MRHLAKIRYYTQLDAEAEMKFYLFLLDIKQVLNNMKQGHNAYRVFENVVIPQKMLILYMYSYTLVCNMFVIFPNEVIFKLLFGSLVW